MPRDLSLHVDESSLIKHNVATIVSIVAAIKGIKPAKGGTDTGMNNILTEVTSAYKYTLWTLERHHSNTVKDIVYPYGGGVWHSEESHQN